MSELCWLVKKKKKLGFMRGVGKIYIYLEIVLFR